MNSEKLAFLILILCVLLMIFHVYWNYDDRVKLINLSKKYSRESTTHSQPAALIVTQANTQITAHPEKNTKAKSIHLIDVAKTKFKSFAFKQITPVSDINGEVLAYPTRHRRRGRDNADTTSNKHGIVPHMTENPLPEVNTGLSRKQDDIQNNFISPPLPSSHVVSTTPTSSLRLKEDPVSTNSTANLSSEQNLLQDRNFSFAFETEPYRGYWVKGKEDLLERTKWYSAAISSLRSDILEKRGFKSWRPANVSNLEVLWGSVDDFHEKLAAREEVKTVYLSWEPTTSFGVGSGGWSSLRDTYNVFLQEFYTWVGTQPLCLWIETPGLTRARWDAVYNRTCLQEFLYAEKPTSLEVVYLHGKPINRNHYWPNDGDFYPEHFYKDPPKFVFYLHIVEDAIVTPPGDVISGLLKLVPYTCAHDTNKDAPRGYESTPIYKEVFILTQFWGNEFFHRMIEMVPRIMPYLDFLRKNTEIMISIPGEDSALRDFLKIFGISPERTVIGTVRAKVAYMPRGTPCGFALVQETQLFSRIMRNYIEMNLSPVGRKKVLMIRRSGLRQFRYNDHIQKSLRQLADEYKLDFEVFPDNPTPPLDKTMRMFYEAVLIVGPHGAGLSNLVFSQPGTIVIEGVCNPPHVNMCFQRVAHVLGHRYHGVPSRAGCENEVQIYPEVIDFIARKYLDLLRNKFQ